MIGRTETGESAWGGCEVCEEPVLLEDAFELAVGGHVCLENCFFPDENKLAREYAAWLS